LQFSFSSAVREVDDTCDVVVVCDVVWLVWQAYRVGIRSSESVAMNAVLRRFA